MYSDIRVFFGQTGTYIESMKVLPCCWQQAEKISRFVPPDALKINSLVLSDVLRFLYPTFSKLLFLSIHGHNQMFSFFNSKLYIFSYIYII